MTHRAQFTGVSWMRSHFLSLVDQSLSSVDPDPKRFLEWFHSHDPSLVNRNN